jgi:hypothetical protein
MCGDQSPVVIEILVIEPMWRPKDISITTRFMMIEMTPISVIHKLDPSNPRLPLT